MVNHRRVLWSPNRLILGTGRFKSFLFSDLDLLERLCWRLAKG